MIVGVSEDDGASIEEAGQKSSVLGKFDLKSLLGSSPKKAKATAEACRIS